jgi:MFS family permease
MSLLYVSCRCNDRYIKLFLTLKQNRWGVAAMCSGAAQNKAGLITSRAFLGFFEAAFGAGAPYFLSLFYQRRELGKRVAMLLGMSPLANCFASSLAYGILHIRARILGWRLLFIIGKFWRRHPIIRTEYVTKAVPIQEDAPTVLCAILVFLRLPDLPDTAKFLTEEEKLQARQRLETVD